jgi:hypothetical protein
MFCAIVGCINLVIWLSITHLLGRRIELAHRRLDVHAQRLFAANVVGTTQTGSADK